MQDSVVLVTRGKDVRFRSDDFDLRPDRKDPHLRLEHGNVYVRDQDRSLRFYLDQLGFGLFADIHFASGDRWVLVSPPDGTGKLALKLAKPGSAEECLVGLVGMITFITEDVEAKYKEWSERGVKFTIPPKTEAWGRVSCRFEDPDGNTFELESFDRFALAIEDRRRALAAKMDAERRTAQELEIAKKFQARLFPQRLPSVSCLDYAGLCIQARSVGGDYYDFLDLGSEHIALVVGDIAGKGIAGALLMANLQANMRSRFGSAIDHPEQFLTSVNRQLFESTTESAYATLFFSEYDNRSGLLRYANCGHLPPLVLSKNGTVERLDATCTVVGLFGDWRCSMAEFRLDDGDILALYTDGVTESFNAEEEEFGERRLVDALRRHRDLPAQELANAVVDEVVQFSVGEQFDDITFIIAKRVSK
jgi:serine phosphatase RsbU (regulator of sigma subunit)/catechol 2,3-dioxygenase-like lactoylglutathione lyase family enzyme